jgi:hypothetical protein
MKQFVIMYVCYLTTLVYYIAHIMYLRNSVFQIMPPEGKRCNLIHGFDGKMRKWVKRMKQMNENKEGDDG